MLSLISCIPDLPAIPDTCLVPKADIPNKIALPPSGLLVFCSSAAESVVYVSAPILSIKCCAAASSILHQSPEGYFAISLNTF